MYPRGIVSPPVRGTSHPCGIGKGLEALGSLGLGGAGQRGIVSPPVRKTSHPCGIGEG